MVRICGAANQFPQEVVAFFMHGDCRGYNIFPIRVVPEVILQNLSCLVNRKTGDMLGEKVLTY